jgi:hypothetical protein
MAGRPTLYTLDMAERAQGLAEQGLTDQEIADELGISVRSLNLYKSKHPEFAAALRMGKAGPDERVEQSLFQRATGYEVDEIDIRVANGEIVQTPIRRKYPPDVTAAIFWLKNRRPDIWRDRREHAHSAPDGGPVQLITRRIVDPSSD